MRLDRYQIEKNPILFYSANREKRIKEKKTKKNSQNSFESKYNNEKDDEKKIIKYLYKWVEKCVGGG